MPPRKKKPVAEEPYQFIEEGLADTKSAINALLDLDDALGLDEAFGDEPDDFDESDDFEEPV